MIAQPDLLAYYAETNAAFLHSYGEEASEKLLNILNAKDDEAILEIGCGTGATLVKLAARNKNIRLSGVEGSATMFKKAMQRLEFSGVKNKVSIQKSESAERFTYANNSMDKIFTESVLAIQDDENLPAMISEINRILKPGGLFMLNETLWLPTVTQKEIDQFNDYCRKHFGIIQCNGTYPYVESWKSLLIEHGYEVLRMERIQDLKSESRRSFNLIEIRSRLFTLKGKINNFFNAELKMEFSRYKRAMDKMFRHKKYLEGMIIVSRNKKEK